MMPSAIAGQISKFNFTDVAAGVADPTYGDDVQTIFEVAWSKLIASAVSVAAKNIDGDEHMRAAFGGTPPTDLAVNLTFPPAAALTFQYAVDELIVFPNGVWIIATGQNGRLGTDGSPQANGPVELTSLSIVSSSDTWTTTLSGIIHTPAHLPKVPFTVSLEESITVLGTTPASFSLQYSASAPTTNYDSSDLKRALILLEVFLGGAIGTLLTGPFGTPLLAYGVSEINSYIDGKLKPLILPFAPLRSVLQGIPQRLPLPGTSDNLWFHYDTVSFPQGLVAQSVGYEGVISQQSGAAIVFSGMQSPLRAKIVGLVVIVGPENVVLTMISGPGSTAKPLPIARQYSALCSDEAINPTFTWSVTTVAGQVVPSVKFSDPHQQAVSVLLDDNGLITPSGQYRIRVQMDDDRHLKDQNGNFPSDVLLVTLTHQTETLPKSGQPRILRPILPK